MATTIIKKLNKPSIIHANANATVVIVGNNSVSNVASGNEIVLTGAIRNIWAGSPSGASAYWIVKSSNSSANSILWVADSTAWMDFTIAPLALPAAHTSITLELVGSANGSIQLEVSKELSQVA